MKITEISEEEPATWGYRGDPLLWRELKERFIDILLPETSEELKILIEKEYEVSTEQSISNEKPIFIERFCSHGMSSGKISPKFWIESGIPLLLSRYAKP